MKSGNLPNILIVAGPTSSGKSDLAIRLARRLNGEIISADSRQVYRGMDIGTGKVIREKLKIKNWYVSGDIRHHLLDIASPKRQYTVAQFQRDATKAIADIIRRGKLPIICGGTGFWIDTLVYDIHLPAVKPNAPLRAQLAKLTTTELYAKLQTLDPVRAASIDRHNPRRLIRALEIVMTTGQPVPRTAHMAPYEPLYLAISVPQDILIKRITKRLDTRLRAGMIAEVNKLHASGVSYARLESFGLEYRAIAKYLQEILKIKNSKLKIQDRERMRSSLLSAIIAYSKRQLTWFKKHTDIHWITKPNEADGLVREQLKKRNLLT